jgi:hypothetical protein
MIKSFKLFEEIRREVPAEFLGNIFKPFNPNKVQFVDVEISLLENEDFVVNRNIAKCEEKYAIYQIKKICPDDNTIIYELIITNKKNNKHVVKKFKASLITARDTLDAVLNICAAYNQEICGKIHSDIDPYGEELWGNDR